MSKMKLLLCSASVFLSCVANAQTLQETQRLAVLNHPSLQSARLGIDIAREDLNTALASRKIRVLANLSSAVQSIGTDRAFGVDVGETFVNQAQIEAILPLYTSGQLNATENQAKLFVEAGQLALIAQEQSILLSAISAHLGVLEASEAIDIRNQNMTRLNRQWEAAQDRFEVGVLTRTDVALAEARYQAASAGFALAEADYTAAIARYTELTGEMPVSLIEPVDEYAAFASAEALLETAKVDNPRIMQLRLLERVAELGVDAARSQRKLKVEAFGTAGIQEGSWNNNFADSSATIGIRASQPIYTGGANLAAERKALARASQARVQTSLARNQVLRDLSSVIAREQAARSTLDSAKKEVSAAKIALEGAEIEVGVGLKTTLDLLDQEQDLLDAQLRLIGARKNVYIAQSQIHAFLGDLGADKPLR